MSLDISAKAIPTIRQTYDHVARRIGEGKAASRYQEATFDIQTTTNFHYRPLWDKENNIYDENRTAIVMKDWYAFTDPRQFYYSAYTMVRAKQQEVSEKNFSFVEKRGLFNSMSDSAKRIVREVIMPLRHVEWGANMNNCAIADFGYGTSITQVAIFNSMDRLGMAQYITRMSLILEENETTGLDGAKKLWMEDEKWQGLRHAVEDTFVLSDWFENMVAQNIVMDGLIFPLIFQRLIDEQAAQGGTSIALLSEFMSDWYAETARWTNALVKVTAKESEANSKQLSDWVALWTDRICEALEPIADDAFESGGDVQLQEVKQQLLDRLGKQGIKV